MQSAQFHLHAAIEDQHWWFVGRRRILRALVERAAAPHQKRLVVDVGCGTGGNLAALAEGYRCLGIDCSAEAIGLARSRFPNLEFRCGAAPEDLGTQATAADVFLLLDVLEHVEDDRGLLGRLVNAAQENARFVVTVPADPALWSAHDVSFGHYRRYDRQRFHQAWEGLPVEVELCSAFNSRLYWPIRLVRQAARWRRSTWGQAETDFSLPRWPWNGLLNGLFAGEQRRLLRAWDEPGASRTRGVSWVAVLRRTTQAATGNTRDSDASAGPERHLAEAAVG